MPSNKEADYSSERMHPNYSRNSIPACFSEVHLARNSAISPEDAFTNADVLARFQIVDQWTRTWLPRECDTNFFWALVSCSVLTKLVTASLSSRRETPYEQDGDWAFCITTDEGPTLGLARYGDEGSHEVVASQSRVSIVVRGDTQFLPGLGVTIKFLDLLGSEVLSLRAVPSRTI
jgi:hypothetical protein